VEPIKLFFYVRLFNEKQEEISNNFKMKQMMKILTGSPLMYHERSVRGLDF
jgi:hypothetical protein